MSIMSTLGKGKESEGSTANKILLIFLRCPMGPNLSVLEKLISYSYRDRRTRETCVSKSASRRER